MTNRVQWRRERRQGLARLKRLSPYRNDVIGAGLYTAQVERLLRSRSVIAATLSDISGSKLADDEIWALAATLNMFIPHFPSIRWFDRAKRSGGLRTICLPDTTLRVRQRLMMLMIVAQQSPNSQIFNWKGRGCPEQARQIKIALEAGNRYVVTADVRDCFPSVNFDAVLDLGLLPREVLRYASDGRHLNFVHVPDPQVNENSIPIYTPTIRVQAGPRGLLQGFGSSDALWVSLISDLPEVLSVSGVPFIYCDNVVVACGTHAAAAQAEEALVRYFSDHRAGPFSLTTHVHNASNSFEHTGYMFSALESDAGVSASIMPSVSNACTLVGRLASDVRRAGAGGMSTAEAVKVFQQRISSFSAVTDDYRDELLSSFIAELEG